MENFSSNRTFKVWEYQVSHGQLLIRSPKAPATARTPECLTNVDLIFLGVEYLAIPRIFHGIEVATPINEEGKNIEVVLGKSVDAGNIIILVSEGKRFVIVASVLKVYENDWDIFRSPFQFRSEFLPNS
jgi:hypothetical protein